MTKYSASDTVKKANEFCGLKKLEKNEKKKIGKKWKNGEKIAHQILIRNLYPEHIKNSYNSIMNRQIHF